MTGVAQHAANKRAVVTGLRSICSTPIEDIERAVAATYADDAKLFAFHPVNEHVGAAAIAASLWRPIRASFPDVERRDQIVIAGDYKDRAFVCTMSQLQGTFANDWLDIPASHGVTSLRCCEVNQITDGKIVEAHVLVDVLDLMHQAGCWPISPSLGAEGAWRSPATQDGVNLDSVDPEFGAAALKLVKDMHAGLLAFDGKDLASMQLAQYWTPNFMWYGPSGIGTTRGLKGFEAHHQIPFLRAFPDRRVANHIANVYDGNYVITGGWPSVVATHTGPDWLNFGPTGRHIEMRVMDFYRVEDGLIAENWVPIDIANILLQMDVDVFARLRHLRGQPRRSL
ncbi:MAG: nuclear transport factor 2 family protein [Gammaproteobacteria bacterium]|nr:nuclear transport factor 2 family protein [Gammaproteobacteria bacterium]